MAGMPVGVAHGFLFELFVANGAHLARDPHLDKTRAEQRMLKSVGLGVPVNLWLPGS